MVPGLRHLATAALPHRPDVAFECVEVTQGWRLQYRRPEPEPGRVEDGVVGVPIGRVGGVGPVGSVAPRNEGRDQLGERLDPHSRRQVAFRQEAAFLELTPTRATVF